MVEEELPLEAVENKARVVFISNRSLDGDASVLGKSRIVRRVYPLIDIKKLVESQKEDKRKLVYLKDVRSRLRGLNQKMRLRMGDVSEYTGTKAEKKDITAREKVIKELKSLQQEDVHALFNGIKTIALPYAQPIVDKTVVDDGMAFRVYRTVKGTGWNIYAEENVKDPQLMIVMDTFDINILNLLINKYLGEEEQIEDEAEEEREEREEEEGEQEQEEQIEELEDI